MAELLCHSLAKAYRKRVVLRDVDLEVPAGTLTAILGASGSGKTTLLRAIIGFIELDAGTVRLDGELVADGERVHVPADKRAIGYVAQEGALFPHLSAGENVGFGLARGERRHGARIAEALALVGLDSSYVERPSHELSGGEQRRVALARALAPRPHMVLLDEPFSGLDAALRVETREAVLHALAEEGTTALLVTHDQAEALSMGREVAVLRDGRLAQRAAPTALYRAPADPDVAEFVGEAVLATGVASGRLVRCALGELAIADPGLEGAVEVMIRPEQIQIARNGVVGQSKGEHAGVAATVIDHAYYGADTVVRLTLDAQPRTVVKARTFEHEIPQLGERVELRVIGPVVVFPERPRATPGAATATAATDAASGTGDEPTASAP